MVGRGGDMEEGKKMDGVWGMGEHEKKW